MLPINADTASLALSGSVCHSLVSFGLKPRREVSACVDEGLA
jgi:hypothetical protein